MSPDGGKAFIQKVADLEEKDLLSLVTTRLRNGDNPLGIIDDCHQGMVEVGERYEKGEYFISSLIVAGELFREVTDLVHPVIKEEMGGLESGEILLGTVHGDIHDLGKNLFGMMMACHGFKVFDIGVDVPPEEFVRQAGVLKPHIIGLSGLLTTAFDSMQETVALLKNAEDREVAQIPIIVGSSLLKSETCKSIGADYWTRTAISGSQYVQADHCRAEKKTKQESDLVQKRTDSFNKSLRSLPFSE